MYESFYGFKEKPFDLHPDPDYLYMSRGHSDVYTHLKYAVLESKGFVVITGEIGSGKTTLINYLLRHVKNDIQIGMVNNTAVPPAQFLKMICQEFEVETNGVDRVGMLERFNQFLLEQFAAKKRVLVIIDEAQNLPRRTLEEIRLLSNLESEKHHLLQIILVGQPELKNRLQQKGLEQFVQRISVHCHLNALSKEEIREYIDHRVEVAGGNSSKIFTDNALDSIALHTQGIPRLINILCDMALVFGFGDGLQSIEKKTIEQAVASREAGGIFGRSAPQEEEQAPAPAPENGAGQQEAWKSRALEERIARLEGTFLTLQQELNSLRKEREARDTIMVELFKILKDSMESRRKLLAWAAKAKQKLEKDRLPTSAGGPNNLPASAVGGANPEPETANGKDAREEGKKGGFFSRRRRWKKPGPEK